MIDVYSISVMVFVVAIAAIVYYDRKNIKRDFVLLIRRTNTGKGFLTKLGKRFPRFWKIAGSLGVVLCFLVSISIFYQFLLITANNLTAEVVPGIGLLLPSPSATASVGPGYFAVPFWYWIIVIGLLALVHEGSHGIMAAREKVRIKSLGWGLFFVIPLAFVEPDERQLMKKKAWQQLRVFAAGSFANFILAAASFAIMGLIVFGSFAQAGVSFGRYPGAKINVSDVTHINSHEMGGAEDIMVECTVYRKSGFGEEIVRVNTSEGSYLSTAESVCEQLNKSAESLVVFEDYSAVKENVTGILIGVNGRSVPNTTVLRDMLEEIGPGKEITVTTTNGTVNSTFVLVTREEPDPLFRPDPQTYIMAGLEHIIPGTIDFASGFDKAFTSLFGVKETVNWQTVQYEISFWKWVGENHPALMESAEEKITRLGAELEKYPKAGFIGISSVLTHLEIKEELKGLSGPIEFIQGLLLWMFLINLGVGAFNLLPVRALDGGRMWEILLQKIISRKRSRSIINNVSLFLVFLIFLNFFIMLKPF